VAYPWECWHLANGTLPNLHCINHDADMMSSSRQTIRRHGQTYGHVIWGGEDHLVRVERTRCYGDEMQWWKDFEDWDTTTRVTSRMRWRQRQLSEHDRRWVSSRMADDHVAMAIRGMEGMWLLTDEDRPWRRSWRLVWELNWDIVVISTTTNDSSSSSVNTCDQVI